jgi:hypothetical protein
MAVADNSLNRTRTYNIYVLSVTPLPIGLLRKDKLYRLMFRINGAKRHKSVINGSFNLPETLFRFNPTFNLVNESDVKLEFKDKFELTKIVPNFQFTVKWDGIVINRDLEVFSPFTTFKTSPTFTV